eukprot:CAMPEP_0181312924 /NCGR_PEP_ID=MMETSP1101-20121128/13966_1 /TAXON_ID=46948 /ORGANISM="Rhodomonas abbreviata, Strain Caron Lab Isolate" /LENGTH=758 /DNA_ID=CAMNT_0023419827 /DNA_START=114 /DNA_END=2390 /DNA_ORIENTATION=+
MPTPTGASGPFFLLAIVACLTLSVQGICVSSQQATCCTDNCGSGVPSCPNGWTAAKIRTCSNFYDEDECRGPTCVQCSDGEYLDGGYPQGCNVCRAGYYCNGFTQVECDSDPGFYCPEGGVNAKGIQCPQGSYCQDSRMRDCEARPGYYCPAGTVLPEGVLCPEGFYCSGGNADALPCNPAPGSYCPEGSQTGAGDDCPAGSYCTSGNRMPCTDLEPGFSCTAGSSSAQGATCARGYYCLGGAQLATACPVNTYNANPGATSEGDCQPCGEGKSSGSGAAECSDVCPAGATLPAGSSNDVRSCKCEDETTFLLLEGLDPSDPASYTCSSRSTCPQNLYCENNGIATPCPEHTTSQIGSTSRDFCQCVAGFFLGSATCQQCPNGETSDIGSTECRPCGDLPCECSAKSVQSSETRRNLARMIERTIGHGIDSTKFSASPSHEFFEFSIQSQVVTRLTGVFLAENFNGAKDAPQMTIETKTRRSCSTTSLSKLIEQEYKSSTSLEAARRIPGGSVGGALEGAVTASSSLKSNRVVNQCTFPQFEITVTSISFSGDQLKGNADFQQDWIEAGRSRDWTRFLSKYGTHIITGATLGGGYLATLDTCQFESEEKALASAVLSYEDALQEVQSSTSAERKDTLKNVRSSDSCEVLGGQIKCADMLSIPMCFDTAMSQFATLSEFMEYKIEPITVFIDNIDESDKRAFESAVRSASEAQGIHEKIEDCKPSEEESGGAVSSIPATWPLALAMTTTTCFLLVSTIF